MERIVATYLRITYQEQSVTFAKINTQFHEYSDMFVFCQDLKMIVVLYSKTRFDIGSEAYIRKHFKIGQTLPELKALSRSEVTETFNKCLTDGCRISTKGMYKVLHDEYTCRLESTRKDREIQRLQAELRKGKEKPCKITNVMIPDLCKHLNIKPLGQEILTVYTIDDLLSIVKRPDGSFVNEDDFPYVFRRLIELIHFDERCPENHNIYVTARKNAECVSVTDSGWHLCMELDSAIPALFATNVEFIFQIYTRNKEECDALDANFSTRIRSLYRKMKYDSSNHAPFKVTDALYSLTKTKLPQLKT